MTRPRPAASSIVCNIPHDGKTVPVDRAVWCRTAGGSTVKRDACAGWAENPWLWSGEPKGSDIVAWRDDDDR